MWKVNFELTWLDSPFKGVGKEHGRPHEAPSKCNQEPSMVWHTNATTDHRLLQGKNGKPTRSPGASTDNSCIEPIHAACLLSSAFLLLGKPRCLGPCSECCRLIGFATFFVHTGARSSCAPRISVHSEARYWQTSLVN